MRAYACIYLPKEGKKILTRRRRAGTYTHWNILFGSRLYISKCQIHPCVCRKVGTYIHIIMRPCIVVLLFPQPAHIFVLYEMMVVTIIDPKKSFIMLYIKYSVHLYSYGVDIFILRHKMRENSWKESMCISLT